MSHYYTLSYQWEGRKTVKKIVTINKILSTDKHGHKTIYSDFCAPWVHLTVVCSRHGCKVKMIITEVSTNASHSREDK